MIILFKHAEQNEVNQSLELYTRERLIKKLRAFLIFFRLFDRISNKHILTFRMVPMLNLWAFIDVLNHSFQTIYEQFKSPTNFMRA